MKPEQYAGSRELRKWASANKTKRYVPEELLDIWGMNVNMETYGIGAWS